jgi:hypothetical protein
VCACVCICVCVRLCTSEYVCARASDHNIAQCMHCRQEHEEWQGDWEDQPTADKPARVVREALAPLVAKVQVLHTRPEANNNHHIHKVAPKLQPVQPNHQRGRVVSTECSWQQRAHEPHRTVETIYPPARAKRSPRPRGQIEKYEGDWKAQGLLQKVQTHLQHAADARHRRQGLPLPPDAPRNVSDVHAGQCMPFCLLVAVPHGL